MRGLLHILLSLLVLATLASPASAFAHERAMAAAADAAAAGRPCHGGAEPATPDPRPSCCVGDHCPCDAMHSAALVPAFGLAAALPPPALRSPRIVAAHASAPHEPPLKPPTPKA